MSIQELPNDVLWMILEKHIYDYTREKWNQLLYNSFIGNQLDVIDTSTINEVVRLSSVCKAFRNCIHKNSEAKDYILRIIKRDHLLHA
jgi:hypothetical protein